MSKKIVIIGGVAAGASTAARLRRLDESLEIIIFEKGGYVSFANCGLPYWIGGVIEQREKLLIQTPESLKAHYNIDVKLRHEVLSIDRENNSVLVRELDSGAEFVEQYDNLVIATGSTPKTFGIPGADLSKVAKLWTMDDADKLKVWAEGEHIKNVAVVGAGPIGVEAAENLMHCGKSVTLIEGLPHVLPTLDDEFAIIAEKELRKNGVKLILDNAVTAFVDTGAGIDVLLSSGKCVSADVVLMSAGLKPNSELAAAAGLELNSRGYIVTNTRQQTSDPLIYAVGDVTDVNDLIWGGKTICPMAGPANKQGRIAANNIMGLSDKNPGSIGTSITKVFSLAATITGMNERSLIQKGLVKGKDYETVTVSEDSHADYYPGACMLIMKLIFSSDGNRLYGAQVIGQEGADKRIDVISALIRLGADVKDLRYFEQAYAPPYSGAKDPVNMLGMTAENVLDGLYEFAEWNTLELEPDAVVIDVRRRDEKQNFPLGVPALDIPLAEFRERICELDKNAKTIVICQSGIRSYNAIRVLKHHGFTNVRQYPGGAWFYRATH